MTSKEWLEKARADRVKLTALIASFHPVVLTGRERIDHEMPITAHAAETACDNVRNNIRRNFEGNPIIQFDEALEAGNVGKIYKLLSDTWFGVPESTQCWKLEGFKEAVDLMDDLPDEEEPDGR